MFTSESAKAASALGHQKRWHSPKRSALARELTAQNAQIFIATALTRVRKQIEAVQDKLDTMLHNGRPKPKNLRDLANVLKELEGVEARLSGRPLPGQLRPNPPRAKDLQIADSPEFSLAPAIDVPADAVKYPDHEPNASVMHEEAGPGETPAPDLAPDPEPGKPVSVELPTQQIVGNESDERKIE